MNSCISFAASQFISVLAVQARAAEDDAAADIQQKHSIWILVQSDGENRALLSSK